ncbi:MAG: hypothetical protein FWD61_07485 [Phycisphaerales bacterium]|nr:hypothetical protein [Phycisphaerales bacterium]
MDQHELLRYVASTLDRLKIPYFVTGSFAGILYGPFRMTNDLDVVIDLRFDQIDAFLAAFPPAEFYVERDAVVDAVRNRFQFNVLHQTSLAKVDFIVAEGSSHQREAFRRIRRIRSTVDYDVTYISPEDIILNKLRFYQESDSQKHLQDIVGILKTSGNSLDLAYIEQWSDWLDVLRSWRKVQQLAKEANP